SCTPCHTSPVAPNPCSSNTTASPEPPRCTLSRSPIRRILPDAPATRLVRAPSVPGQQVFDVLDVVEPFLEVRVDEDEERDHGPYDDQGLRRRGATCTEQRGEIHAEEVDGEEPCSGEQADNDGADYGQDQASAGDRGDGWGEREVVVVLVQQGAQEFGEEP